jgi:hypothetical protein
VVIETPVDATASSWASRNTFPDSNIGTDKPNSLISERGAPTVPEVKEWRNEKPSTQEQNQRGTASGPGNEV